MLAADTTFLTHRAPISYSFHLLLLIRTDPPISISDLNQFPEIKQQLHIHMGWVPIYFYFFASPPSLPDAAIPVSHPANQQ